MIKIDSNIKKAIKTDFLNLKNINDFVLLLEKSNRLLFPKNIRKEITLQNISYFAFHNKNKYETFSIAKKNGSERIIYAPVRFLKLIQRNLNFILNIIFQPIKPVNGFSEKRNIVTNAQAHTGKPFVYNIDLENFFPSIKFRRVKSVFELQPFNLKEKKESIAYLIANLCCVDGFLPQGSPTSPIISNIVCQRLDKRLVILARSYKAKYSRYADDITFSSYKNIYDENFHNEVKQIIEEEQFTINEQKTRLQHRNERQEVTGLTVNEKVNINRNYIRTTRAMLNNWDKKGLEKAIEKYEKHYEKKHLYSKTPSFKEVLRGRILFIGMVRGQKDDIYIKSKMQYDDLKLRDKRADSDFLNKILYIWEVDSIEKAIKEYNRR